MALPESYLITTSNLDSMLKAIVKAQAPTKFTTRFLENLDFKSVNDRLFIGVLKSLGFLDTNGIPQELYFNYIDETQSARVLASAIKEAYSDLFALNTHANEMTVLEVKNKLKTLFQGAKSEEVLKRIATTFVGLCSLADFSAPNNQKKTDVSVQVKSERKDVDDNYSRAPHLDGIESLEPFMKKTITTELHYNIQLHLPETQDISVYDAIFESLKKHLL